MRYPVKLIVFLWYQLTMVGGEADSGPGGSVIVASGYSESTSSGDTTVATSDSGKAGGSGSLQLVTGSASQGNTGSIAVLTGSSAYLLPNSVESKRCPSVQVQVTKEKVETSW